MSTNARPFTPAWWSQRLPLIQAQGLTIEDFEESLNEQVEHASDEGLRQGDKPNDQNSPHSMAAQQYRYNLPAIHNRRAAQLHIASVVQGLQLNFITISDAKVFLYAAQLALASFALQRPEPPPYRNMST